ncbi:MAG: TonB-dependent receptor [Pseudomonadota bacterium]
MLRGCQKLALLLLFFPSLAIYADEKQNKECEYNTIARALKWDRTTSDDPAGFSTVITIDDPMPGTELSDLLTQVPGLRVKNTGIGARASFSLRGAQSKQSVVFLDGVRLTSAMGVGVDLSLISPAHLEVVEVRRSAGSARFGSNALGGVLILKTPKLRMRQHTNISAGYGSWNSVDVRASHGAALGNIRYLASGSFRRSDGDFSFVDQNGTPRVRLNNNSQMGEVLLKVDHLYSAKWHVGLINSFAVSERGAPGLSYYPSETARQQDLRNLSALHATRYDLLVNGDSLNFSVHHNYESFRFNEPTPPMVDSQNKSFSFGGSTDLQMPLPDVGRVDGGVDLRTELFRDPATNNPIRLSADVWLAGQMNLLWKHVVLAPAVRLSMASEFSPTVVPKVGLVLRPFQKSKNSWLFPLQIAGNLGRSFRHPSFQEMYVRLDGFGGNTDLEPEDAIVGDAGLRWVHPLVSAEVSYFRRRMKNTILFAPVSSFLVRADNYSGVTAEGLETALEANPGLCFCAQITYTFTRAEFGDPVMRLPGQPAHRFVTKLGWDGDTCTRSSKAKWRWFHGLKLSSGVTVESDMVLSRFNTTKEEGRVLLSVGGKYTYRWLTVAAEGRNLLDKRDALDMVGFPLAPAQFWVSLAVNL